MKTCVFTLPDEIPSTAVLAIPHAFGWAMPWSCHPLLLAAKHGGDRQRSRVRDSTQ